MANLTMITCCRWDR